MKRLFLEDLKAMTEGEVIEHVAQNYAGKASGFDYGNPSVDDKQVVRTDMLRFNVLIAYESVGSWGCDSSSYFLMKEKSTGELFEFSGSHCSCYGFEGQYSPEPVSIEYLKSDKFYLPCGGYDNDAGGNKSAVKEYLAKL